MFSHWQVLHVKPRCEKKVAETCRAYNIPYYLPLRTEVKIYQRRRVTVEKPLFTGYLFAAVTRETQIHLTRTNKIIRFLTPQKPMALLRDLVQLRRALRADPALQSVPSLTKGQRVRIIDGPFRGVEGLVERLSGTMRVVLTVDMIGMGVAVSADLRQVEPI